MTRVYAQLYDYAVIVSLRKNPDSNIYEPYVKFKFPPQVSSYRRCNKHLWVLLCDSVQKQPVLWLQPLVVAYLKEDE